MTRCTRCARRRTCRSICPAVRAQLPPLHRGRLPLLEPAILETMPADQAGSPGGRPLLLEQFRQAWSRLSRRQRQVVRLFYLEGLSEAQAARRLGISQPMVFRHRRRALKKIASVEVIESHDW